MRGAFLNKRPGVSLPFYCSPALLIPQGALRLRLHADALRDIT